MIESKYILPGSRHHVLHQQKWARWASTPPKSPRSTALCKDLGEDLRRGPLRQMPASAAMYRMYDHACLWHKPFSRITCELSCPCHGRNPKCGARKPCTLNIHSAEAGTSFLDSSIVTSPCPRNTTLAMKSGSTLRVRPIAQKPPALYDL